MKSTLSLSRYCNQKNSSGFTIIELLVVIIVLGILAGIVIVLYGNVTSQARDTALQSDLQTAQSQLDAIRIRTSTYPASESEINNGSGLSESEGNTLTYEQKPYGYCISASNPKASSPFRYRTLEKRISQGDCSPSVTLLAGSTSSTGYANGHGTDARFDMRTDLGIVATESGDVFVSEFYNHRIRKISSEGEVTTYAGSGDATCTTTPTPAETVGIYRPLGMTYDDRTDTLYFLACSGSRLFKATPDGMVSSISSGFYWARGVTFGPDRNIYVMGTENQRIYKVNPSTGAYETLAGSSTGYADGTGTAAQFNWPTAGAFDKDGNLIVKDSRNYRLRKIDSLGTVTTIAGTGASGNTNGPMETATFTSSYPMTGDKYGNLYLYDTNAIRKVGTDGIVSNAVSDWVYSYTPTYGGIWGLTAGPDGALYAAGAGTVIKIIL